MQRQETNSKYNLRPNVYHSAADGFFFFSENDIVRSLVMR